MVQFGYSWFDLDTMPIYEFENYYMLMRKATDPKLITEDRLG